MLRLRWYKPGEMQKFQMIQKKRTTPLWGGILRMVLHSGSTSVHQFLRILRFTQNGGTIMTIPIAIMMECLMNSKSPMALTRSTLTLMMTA